MSVSNTCMHYSKRALAPIVSLVTMLFNSVLWLGSRAKSSPGKGIQQEVIFSSSITHYSLFLQFPELSVIFWENRF